MAPDWTDNWTIHEAATILLHDAPEYQMELPYERCPANQRLSSVWDSLTRDCQFALQVNRDAF